MKKSKSLLTVGIPTYNRSKTLEKIILQLQKEKQPFDILVSDNNSSDNTQALVRKYQKTMHNLRYNRNEINLGFSGNILKLYELAKTRYIWFLADDDEVLPGAIDKIIQSLNKYKPVVALFNHLKVDPYGKKYEEGVNKDVLYNGINELPDYGSIIRTVFLSIIVVEKRLPFSVIKKIYNKDNVFFQITLSLYLLSNKFKFCEIASAIVFRNQSYKTGEFFKFILVDNLAAMCSFKHKFNNNIIISFYKKQIIKALKLYLSQKLGLFKFYGNPSWQTIKRIIQYYGFTSIFILSFPIIYFLVPKFIIQFIYKVQLIRIYGKSKGLVVYSQNLNRVLNFKTISAYIN